jgi:class 3 adenylate cyclase
MALKSTKRVRRIGREAESVLKGTHSVLGMDVTAFSRLDNEDQGNVIEKLLGWVRAALAFNQIEEGDYRWSPAGDGGYLTFVSPKACARAVDVALAIMEHLRDPEHNKQNRQMRFAIHAGQIIEAEELGRGTNIWGEGINVAARILNISAPGQILVSEQYFGQYIKGKREDLLQCSATSFIRTVKHGEEVEVRNICRDKVGIQDGEAQRRRWAAVGGLWQKTILEYEFLVADAMNSGDAVAAVAAAKFLMGLKPSSSAVEQFFQSLSYTGDPGAGINYKRQSHVIFSNVPPEGLRKLVERARPRQFNRGELICNYGDVAESCFFPVSGGVEVELDLRDNPTIPQGEIVGEFGLWIRNIRRTASLRAKDDCLLLEVDFKAFQDTLDRYPATLNVIIAKIKSRILANVADSPAFFPEVSQQEKDELKALPCSCEKWPAGEVLDLRTHVYILFAGRVRTFPTSRSFEISAPAQIGHERAVGVVSLDEPSSVDGDTAVLQDESVFVSIPRELVLAKQESSERVQAAWTGLWDQRRREMERRPRNKQAESSAG